MWGEATVEELERDKRNLQDTIFDLERELKDLQYEFDREKRDNREDIANIRMDLEDSIAERDSRIDGLERIIQEKDIEISNREDDIGMLEDQLDVLEAEAAGERANN